MTFLNSVGDSLRMMTQYMPLSVARWLMIAVYLVLLFWVVQLSSVRTTPAHRVSKWFEDLRVWAWIAIMFQIAIYSVL